jgi:hypothetical protein
LVSNFITGLLSRLSGAQRASFRTGLAHRRAAGPQLSRQELRRAVADMID